MGAGAAVPAGGALDAVSAGISLVATGSTEEVIGSPVPPAAGTSALDASGVALPTSGAGAGAGSGDISETTGSGAVISFASIAGVAGVILTAAEAGNTGESS